MFVHVLVGMFVHDISVKHSLLLIPLSCLKYIFLSYVGLPLLGFKFVVLVGTTSSNARPSIGWNICPHYSIGTFFTLLTPFFVQSYCYCCSCILPLFVALVYSLTIGSTLGASQIILYVR